MYSLKKFHAIWNNLHYGSALQKDKGTCIFSKTSFIHYRLLQSIHSKPCSHLPQSSQAESVPIFMNDFHLSLKNNLEWYVLSWPFINLKYPVSGDWTALSSTIQIQMKWFVFYQSHFFAGLQGLLYR